MCRIPPFVWAVLTEDHLCHACSFQEILRRIFLAFSSLFLARQVTTGGADTLTEGLTHGPRASSNDGGGLTTL
eukprot:COSAG01_NODE_30_length_36127_cov_41.433234_4_plen_73_part_00